MVDVCARRLRGEHRALQTRHVPRLRRGGVNVQFLMVGGDAPVLTGDSPDPDAFAEALYALDTFYAELDEGANEIAVILSATDLDVLEPGEKIKFVLHLEGSRPFGADLALLRTLFRLGVRSVGLAWNHANEVSDSCMDSRGAGLSDFGRSVIAEMNRLGIIVDISHLSDQGVLDVLEVTSRPVVASHCNARAICNSRRNLTDEQIKGIAGTGGVIGVCFYPPMVKNNGFVSVDDVLNHVDYLAKLVGTQHIGIGPDFIDYVPEAWLDSAPLAPFREDFRRPFPSGLEDVTRIPNLLTGLSARGYSDEDLANISHANFLRVMQACLPDAAERGAVRHG